MSEKDESDLFASAIGKVIKKVKRDRYSPESDDVLVYFADGSILVFSSRENLSVEEIETDA